jgi:hypothetical protein
MLGIRRKQKMEIQKNSRQIPSDKIYTANKQYSDILYGYLQHNSYLDENTKVRFIPKKEISYVKIAEILNMHRQTVSSKFNGLIKQGLIYFNEAERRYELVAIDSNLATLLPDETIRVCYNTLQDRCLSILAYLLKTFVQHGEESCRINLDMIKSYVGVCVSNRGCNNQIVKDCLMVLEKLGFIQYHVEKEVDPETGGVKTIYLLDKVNNFITFDEKVYNQ